MARTKKDDNSLFLLLAAFLCAIPLLIFGAIRYIRLRRYLRFSDTHRVFDIGVTLKYPLSFGFIVILTLMFMFGIAPSVIGRFTPETQAVQQVHTTSTLAPQNDMLTTSPASTANTTPNSKKLSLTMLYAATFVFVLVVTIAGTTCTKLFAADLIGCLVIPSQGIAVVPRGFRDFVLEDYLTLRFLWRVGEMSELPLAQIRTLTRQAGTQLHIHGDFGSRSVRFSNKQKRDEYLSALLQHTRSRMNREIE